MDATPASTTLAAAPAATIGREPRRRRVPELLVFLGVLFYGLFLPLLNDDPYITARYARQLAAGEGFTYNSGEQVLGTTTPLATLLTAALMVALPDEAALRLAAALMLALASLAFIRFGRAFNQPLAGLAAALILPALGAVTLQHGGEAPLCIGLGLLAAAAVARDRPVAAGSFGGLMALARGEGLLLVGVLGLWLLRRAGWRNTTRFGLAAAAMLAPWLVFSRLYFGEWLPHTLEVKRIQGALAAAGDSIFVPYLEGVAHFFQSSWLLPLTLFIPLAWLGLWRLRRPAGLLLLAWAAGHTLAYSWLQVPGNYGWYQYPLFALTAWAAGCGFEMALGAIRQRLGGRPGPMAAAALALAIAAIGAVQQSIHLRPARQWLHARHQAYLELADDYLTLSAPEDLLLIDEIGIIGFHVWPRRLRDSNGLIHRDLSTPELIDFQLVALRFVPEWIKTYHSQGEWLILGEGDAARAWGLAGSYGAPPFSATLYRRLEQVPPQHDQGLYPAEDWGGVRVHWTRRGAELPLPQPPSGRALRVRYHVGHPDVSDENPLELTLSLPGRSPLLRRHAAAGYHEAILPLDGATSGPLRIELDRTWTSPEGRQLGIGLYPLQYESTSQQ